MYCSIIAIAIASNMKYTNITVQMPCAPEKFFHVLWNELVQFDKGLILLVTFA